MFWILRSFCIAPLFLHLIAPPFEKKCQNCHVEDVIISPTCNVYCNACDSKINSSKSSFFFGDFIANQWWTHVVVRPLKKANGSKVIVHMIKVCILETLCLCKTSSNFSFQFTFVVKFWLIMSMFALVSFKTFKQFIPSRNDFALHDETFGCSFDKLFLTINVQQNVKHKSNFDESRFVITLYLFWIHYSKTQFNLDSIPVFLRNMSQFKFFHGGLKFNFPYLNFLPPWICCCVFEQQWQSCKLYCLPLFSILLSHMNNNSLLFLDVSFFFPAELWNLLDWWSLEWRKSHVNWSQSRTTEMMRVKLELFVSQAKIDSCNTIEWSRRLNTSTIRRQTDRVVWEDFENCKDERNGSWQLTLKVTEILKKESWHQHYYKTMSYPFHYRH